MSTVKTRAGRLMLVRMHNTTSNDQICGLTRAGNWTWRSECHCGIDHQRLGCETSNHRRTFEHPGRTMLVATVC